METQTPSVVPNPTMQDPISGEFQPGSIVVYALHGKCTVAAIETRKIGGETIRFYKLEVQKSALSRSSRQDPAIWLPVNSAQDRGLRPFLNAQEAEAVLKVLTNREYYFPIQDSWQTIQPQLEACIRAEGATGMAKVASYLHVLKRKQIVPSQEVTRLDELVKKQLLRELSEALGKNSRTLEEILEKGFRQKLLPDT